MKSDDHLVSLFSPADVLCRTPVRERDDLVRMLVERVGESHGLANTEAVFREVLEREQQSSTVVAPGVALPHARCEGLDSIALAVATSEAGIVFSAEDAEPVRLVVLILSPRDQPGAYARVLQSLSSLLRDPVSLRRIRSATTPGEVWNLFHENGLALPPYVCAADIMRAEVVTLRDSDTLETAIDTFVKQNLADIPVVDAEGDLVGVVSEETLLHVCLPDYILWMEDLSPIIRFQPFAQILRNEGRTWLADILSLDYAAVQERAPAIQVAKEMARQDVRSVLVLRGKKLAGIITIQEFITKVLRE